VRQKFGSRESVVGDFIFGGIAQDRDSHSDFERAADFIIGAIVALVPHKKREQGDSPQILQTGKNAFFSASFEERQQNAFLLRDFQKGKKLLFFLHFRRAKNLSPQTFPIGNKIAFFSASSEERQQNAFHMREPVPLAPTRNLRQMAEKYFAKWRKNISPNGGKMLIFFGKRGII